jgi:hypothetical protein
MKLGVIDSDILKISKRMRYEFTWMTYLELNGMSDEKLENLYYKTADLCANLASWTGSMKSILKHYIAIDSIEAEIAKGQTEFDVELGRKVLEKTKCFLDQILQSPPQYRNIFKPDTKTSVVDERRRLEEKELQKIPE